MSLVEENLKQCQVKLRWGSRVSFGNIVRSLVEKRNLLKKAELVALNGGSANWVHQLKGEIQVLLS